VPYRESTRQYWLAVANNKCQWIYYDENRGWVQCNQTATHVHHIIPEGILLDEGEDSERSVGLPLCRNHHVKNLGSVEFEERSSMHPDTAIAYQEYGDWKQRTSHLRAITGIKSDEPSPFVTMSRRHREHRDNGDRYHTGTEATDQYYIDHMKELECRYIAETGKKRPKTKPHADYDPTKKKKWFNFLE